MKDYQAYYDECYKAGDEYARFINSEVQKQRGKDLGLIEGFENQLVYGDTLAGVELKFDRKRHRTGNLCIECAARSSLRPGTECRPEGVYRDDRCRWYGVGDYQRFFVFEKEVLRRLHRESRYRAYRTSTSHGFLLPESDAHKWAIVLMNWPGNHPLCPRGKHGDECIARVPWLRGKQGALTWEG